MLRLRSENLTNSLVVVDFDGIHTADEVLNTLRSFQKEDLIDLEDACIVERDKTGKVYIKQAVNLIAIAAVTGGSRGALWGALVNLLLLNPLSGMTCGAITGAGAGVASGSLADYGIPDDFVRKLSGTIPKESSALFIHLGRRSENKLLPVIEALKPRILRTSLSNYDEEKLIAALYRKINEVQHPSSLDLAGIQFQSNKGA